GVAEPAGQCGQVQRRPRAGGDRGQFAEAARWQSAVQRARQRYGFRYAICGQTVWRIPAPAQGWRLSRDRHRSGQRASGADPSWRADLGRGRGRQGGRIPFHSSTGARRAKLKVHNMNSLRSILIAEDSSADAEMATDAMREARLTNPIVHVEDGVEALDYLLCRGAFAGRSDGLPVVLLLDIKMPRMDGLEVLQRIRAEEELKRLPVVILSSSREESDLAR